MLCLLSFLPLQSLLTFGVSIFPSNDSHKYVDLPDKLSSALCGVGRVNFHVCGGYLLYMCVERSVHVCVCIHVHMCTYCYCTHTYSINLCHLLHTVIYGCLCVNCQGLSSHMTVTCTNGVTCHHCVCTIIRRHVGDVYLGMSPIKNLCTSSG